MIDFISFSPWLEIILFPLPAPTFILPRNVGGEEKHGIIIIKDEIVGAIHELPLRNTN